MGPTCPGTHRPLLGDGELWTRTVSESKKFLYVAVLLCVILRFFASGVILEFQAVLVWSIRKCFYTSFPAKCPRSHLHPVIAGAECASRSRRQNSWWKCRRSYPTLRYAGLWSRMLTFQFLVVAEIVLLQRRLLVCWLRQIKGVFRTFPEGKSATMCPHPGSELGAETSSSRISSRMQLLCGCGFQVVGGNFWARTQKSGGLGDLRTAVRKPQLAEQLVEVPTIVSFSLLQRTMEQNVDIPVLGRGGRNAGLQGFLPRQSSTAQLASQERISERIVEQIVEFRWRPSRFSPRTEFICIFFISSWCPWFCR